MQENKYFTPKIGDIITKDLRDKDAFIVIDIFENIFSVSKITNTGSPENKTFIWQGNYIIVPNYN